MGSGSPPKNQPDKACRGQALTEFALMMVMMLGIAAMMALLLAVFAESGWRLVSLVSLDL